MSLDSVTEAIVALRQRAARLRARIADLPIEDTVGGHALEELGATLEAVQVAGEELRQQSEELAAAREALETERQQYRAQAEVARRASEEQLRVALEAANLGAWHWNIVTGEVRWSENLEAIHGLAPETFGGSFEDYLNDVHPEDRERVATAIRRSLEERLPHEIEYRLLWSDGSIHWVMGRGRVLCGSDGQPVAMTGVCLDVTERRRAEQALRESEERFVRFTQHLPGLAWIKDRQGRYVYANDAAEKVFRTPQEQLYGMTDDDVFSPETATQFRENDGQVLTSGMGIQTIETLEHGDGVLHHSIVSKFPIPGPDGQAVMVGGMAIDITDRLRAERHLAAQYAVTRVLAEAATLAEAAPRILQAVCESAGWEVGAVWAVDEAAKLLRCLDVWHVPGINVEAFESVTRGTTFPRGSGLPGRVWSAGEPSWIEDVVGEANFPRSPYAAQVGLHGAFAFPIWVRDCVTGVIEFFSRQVRRSDHELLEMFDAVGKQVGHFVERRQAEEASHRLAAIVESSEDAIIGKTLDGTITTWNAGADRLYGYAAGEVIGRPIALLLPPEREDELPEILERLRRGERIEQYETVRLRRDGRRIDVSITVSSIRDRTGRSIGASEIARDISDRKRAEEALREADRRKDEFLAVLAHELRNPLAPIRSAVELLKRLAPPEPRVVRAQEIIERQVRHQARLLDDLLDVSRITRGTITLRPVRLDLSRLLQEASDDCRSLVEEAGLALILELPEEPLWVDGDPTRLAQVVGNLLRNSAKFTDHGGEVTLRLAAEPKGHQAAITVLDTGIGIEPEMLPHLFEPFAQGDRSLDRSRGGLGLGLATVKGLVELHKGEVRAYSEGSDRGASFTVLLPMADPPAAERVCAAPAAGTRGSRRILIVEDNRDAASMLGDLLELYGFTTAVAHSGPEALVAARQFQPQIVLCDLGLPGMDGYEVAKALRREPATAESRLIVLSGYGQTEDRRRSREAGFDLHLTKPVDPAELQRALESSPDRREP